MERETKRKLKTRKERRCQMMREEGRMGRGGTRKAIYTLCWWVCELSEDDTSLELHEVVTVSEVHQITSIILVCQKLLRKVPATS